ncbi:transcription antitermination factor NusB [Chlamydiales bacterium]|nr:transcription antitermination factor NusB [Chlamydiales bacterium]
MSIPHKKSREIIFLILFSQDVNETEGHSLESLVRQELEISKKSFKLAEKRVEKIKEYLNTIDLIIQRISAQYDYEKLQKVEKNILRLSSYEILYDADIPPKVAIAEAIRLAKKFSTPQASKFINALLDHLYKESIGETNLDKVNVG